MDDDELREWFASITLGIMRLSAEVANLRDVFEEDDGDDGEEEDLT